jgi:hypothetical protein
MNDIIKHAGKLREELRLQRGNYRTIADKSGITYHWLVAFAQGKIQNPTIKNIAALDAVLRRKTPPAA